MGVTYIHVHNNRVLAVLETVILGKYVNQCSCSSHSPLLKLMGHNELEVCMLYHFVGVR